MAEVFNQPLLRIMISKPIMRECLKKEMVHLVHLGGEGWGGSLRYICLSLFYIFPNYLFDTQFLVVVGYLVAVAKGKKENVYFLTISHNKISANIS